MSVKLPPLDFDRDLLFACRYAYYCEAKSLLPDEAYDALEAEYVMVNGPLPVGSDRREDYDPAVRALALYFMLSGRTVSSSLDRNLL